MVLPQIIANIIVCILIPCLTQSCERQKNSRFAFQFLDKGIDFKIVEKKKKKGVVASP